MNSIKSILYSLAVGATTLVGFTACSEDGDIITTNGADAITLTGSGDVVLNSEDVNALALTLIWNDNSTISLNDDRVQAPKNATTNTLQFSATEDFATRVEQLTDDGATSAQYTMEGLNSLVERLGLESGVASPLYIRMSSSLADNLDAQLSNTYSLNVTPYTIDMTHGYILDANKTDTGWTLYSATSNGVYSGFLGVAAWYNFWLQEGNGTTWGNDGVTGTPFLISSEDSHWNFWYPGQSGCYYTVVNTTSQEWSALYIPSLTVSGDVTGEMTYNRKENTWTLTFSAETAGQKTVQIAGTGSQYNASTGTDDAAAISTPVAFGGSCDALTFGTSASNITVDVPSTGDVTLTLNLSDPAAWTFTATAGAAPDEPTVAQQLWAVGIDDGTSGGWNFDQYLTLTDADNLTYAGAINVNSLWGYRLYTENGSWDNYYTAASGDATAGMLVMGGDGNITAPTAGLYVVEASLSALTYATTAISSVQITGIGDNWTLVPMTATETAGVYTADIDITASTPWGYQIILNEDWSAKFGGTAEQLIYKGENIPLDDSYIGSTCTFTVDLCKGTITITKK